MGLWCVWSSFGGNLCVCGEEVWGERCQKKFGGEEYGFEISMCVVDTCIKYTDVVSRCALSNKPFKDVGFKQLC